MKYKKQCQVCGKKFELGFWKNLFRKTETEHIFCDIYCQKAYNFHWYIKGEQVRHKVNEEISKRYNILIKRRDKVKEGIKKRNKRSRK